MEPAFKFSAASCLCLTHAQAPQHISAVAGFHDVFSYIWYPNYIFHARILPLREWYCWAQGLACFLAGTCKNNWSWGCANDWEPDSLINPHGEIVMFIFEPLEWCNWLDSEALMLKPSTDRMLGHVLGLWLFRRWVVQTLESERPRATNLFLFLK